MAVRPGLKPAPVPPTNAWEHNVLLESKLAQKPPPERSYSPASRQSPNPASAHGRGLGFFTWGLWGSTPPIACQPASPVVVCLAGRDDSLPPSAAPVVAHRYFKTAIARQIEYYFSDRNLAKDAYLRSLFDPSDGSVSLRELTRFPRLQQLVLAAKNDTVVLEVVSEMEQLEIVHEGRSVRLKAWREWV